MSSSISVELIPGSPPNVDDEEPKTYKHQSPALEIEEDEYDEYYVEQLDDDPDPEDDHVDSVKEDDDGVLIALTHYNKDVDLDDDIHQEQEETEEEFNEYTAEDTHLMDIEEEKLCSSKCDTTTTETTQMTTAAAEMPDTSTNNTLEQHTSANVEDTIVSPEPGYPCAKATLKRDRKRQLLRRKLLARKRRAKEASSKSTAAATKVEAPAPSVAAFPAIPAQSDPEDTYFALSLVGSLQRLQPQQRAMAKMNIVRYLTEMAFTDTAKI